MSMLTSILKKLIAFKTLSLDHQENERALVWIKNQLVGLPLRFKKFKFNGFPALVITTRPTKKPRLWLAAHLDVVPGSSAIFKPMIKGGRLYGRGAFDMKFALACYLNLLLTLGKKVSHYDLGIMITTDEEVGGANGSRALLNKFGGEVCILRMAERIGILKKRLKAFGI